MLHEGKINQPIYASKKNEQDFSVYQGNPESQNTSMSLHLKEKFRFKKRNIESV